MEIEVAATSCLVRFWASARAIAGVPEATILLPGKVTLDQLVSLVVKEHSEPRLEAVLRSCSVLVGDLPVSSQAPAEVVIEPGSVVEFLPPFAGG